MLTIWNDKTKIVQAAIRLKEEIMNFRVKVDAVYLILKNKVSLITKVLP